MRESSTMVEAGRSTGKNHPIAATYNGRPSSQQKKTATAVSTADGSRRRSSFSTPRDNDQRSAAVAAFAIIVHRLVLYAPD
jgi:hypothetical protein